MKLLKMLIFSCSATFMLALTNCKKDKNMEIVKTVENKVDYRTKYLGDFDFKVEHKIWSIVNSSIYDNYTYTGVIRKYELNDSKEDFYSYDDKKENPDEKITIEFSQDKKITSIIDTNGTLMPKQGPHYYHEGRFIHIDTINFYIGGLGGQGGGETYTIVGVRKK